MFYLFFLVPSAPQQPALSTVPGSPSELVATWSSPAEPNGVILFYTIQCSSSDTSTTTFVSGNRTRTTVTGLVPYTNYSCYIFGNTSVGAGNSSAVRSARTDESGEFYHCQITYLN